MKSNINEIIIVICVVVIVLIIGVYVQRDIYYSSQKYCDEKYGICGWTYNETTGTGDCKGYIGQCWKCVPITNSEPKGSTQNTG